MDAFSRSASPGATATPDLPYDLVILGGGPAGMSAALVAGRARLRVAIVNEERPRNRVTAASHGFWTRDGTHALELLEAGKRDLAKYRTVDYRLGHAAAVARTDGVFTVQLGAGRPLAARRLLIATGHRDDLAALELPGIEETYGKSIFPCPFCDGFEHSDERIAVFGGKGVEQHVPLLRMWSKDVEVFTNGRPLEEAAKAAFRRNGVPYHEGKVVRIESTGGRLEAIRLEAGRVQRDVGFLWDKAGAPASTFADDLGVPRNLNPWGVPMYAADEFGRTDVPGLYVIGDARTGFQRLVQAAAEGARCAEGIIHDMAKEGWK